MDNQGYPEQRYVVTALMRYLVAAILFVALVAVFAWFFFFRGTDTSGDETSRSEGSSQNGTQQPDSNSSNGSDGNNTGSDNNDDATIADDNSTTTGRTDAEGESSTTSEGDQTSSDELADTGPGDIVAIFLGTVIVAATLRRYQLSRANQ